VNINLFSSWPMSKNMAYLADDSSVLHKRIILIIMAFAIIIRIICFQGYSDSDPRDYAILADQLAIGILNIPFYEGPPVFPLRVATYSPSALFISLFGLSEISLVAFPLFVSVASCLLIYYLARLLISPSAALISLVLFASLPIDITIASRLLPDGISAFWSNLGIYLCFIALIKSNGLKTIIFGVMAGVSFGASWLSKESVFFLIPFVIFLLLFYNPNLNIRNRMLLVISISFGSLSVLFGELFFYYIFTGDALFRFHATERNYIQFAMWFFDSSSPFFGWQEGGYLNALLQRLFFSGPKVIFFSSSLSFIPAFATVVVIWALFFRIKAVKWIAVWFISLLLMFNFMSSSFEAYKPLVLFDTYLYPIIFPAIMLCGWFIDRLLVGSTSLAYSKYINIICLFLIIISLTFFSIKGIYSGVINKRDNIERQVAKLLEVDEIIYSDFRTIGNLVFLRENKLLKSSETNIAWEKMSDRQIPKGSYVLINNTKIEFLSKAYDYKAPEFVNILPSNWRVVREFNGNFLFVVD
jgi:4-amino-4-deoxy-L-arabinose transferase-like glycosyltransferase